MAGARRVEGYQFEPEYTEEEVRLRRALAIETENNSANVNNVAHIDIDKIRENCSCGGCTSVVLEEGLTLEQELQKYLSVRDTRLGVICCKQIGRISRFMREKPDMLQPECIGEHMGFKSMCLNRIVLETNHKLYLTYRRRRQNLPDVFTNQELRYTAYRNFSGMFYKKLGRNNRRCLPICALLKIRSNYPENNRDDYVGYQIFNPREVEEALND